MNLPSLSSRLVRYLGLGLLVLIIVFTSGQGIFHVSLTERNINNIALDQWAKLQELDSLQSKFNGIRTLFTASVVYEQTELDPLIQKIASLIKESEALAGNQQYQEYQELMVRFAKKMKEYRLAMLAYAKEVQVRRTGDQVRDWEQVLLETENEAHATILEIKGNIRTRIGELQESLLENGRRAKTVSSLLAVLGIIVGIIVAVLLHRALARPVQELIEASKAVAGGDLRVSLARSADGEIGLLSVSISSMVADLQRLVRGIKGTSRDVGSSANRLDQLSGGVSEGAELQSREIKQVTDSAKDLDAIIRQITPKVKTLTSSLEDSSSSTQEMAAVNKEISNHADRMYQEVDQISSSLTEISTNIGQTVDFLDQLSTASQQSARETGELTASITQVGGQARKSGDFAAEVTEKAKEHGAQALERMVAVSHRNKDLVDNYSALIRSLGEKSSSIGQILEVIQDIADQANLLSLNAAIIAAQAGEQGRGFAVVATEVRKLSSTTSENVKQIGKVIQSVQGEVGEAVRMVGEITEGMESGIDSANQAGTVLKEIEDISSQSAQMSREISNSVGKQVGVCREILGVVTRNFEEVKRVSLAMDEQKKGSKVIIASTEEIRLIADQLKKSTTEQAGGSAVISNTITQIHKFSEEILKTMNEGQTASIQIVDSVGNIAQVSDANLIAVEDLDKLVKEFGILVEKLDSDMTRFKLPEKEEAPSRT